MSKTDSTVTLPKSMRHKRILDVAADNPDASVAELAEKVPSATTVLVENVLEEYGDPADTTDTNPTPNKASTATEAPLPSPSDLSAVQRDTASNTRASGGHPTGAQ